MINHEELSDKLNVWKGLRTGTMVFELVDNHDDYAYAYKIVEEEIEIRFADRDFSKHVVFKKSESECFKYELISTSAKEAEFFEACQWLLVTMEELGAELFCME